MGQLANPGLSCSSGDSVQGPVHTSLYNETAAPVPPLL